ncbi:MAG: phosphohistidine phosphatase SixA [Gemmatimonadaceae bacterium]|nr:phosphohistidine phosphatase SixA [Gemmatimonadaceae bacterium]
MQLLVIRHAIAEDKEAFAETGRPDDERPLTKRGRKTMAKATRGLRREVKSLDVLAASPLVRAKQTAAIVAAEYGDIFIDTVSALEPGATMSSFATWLATRRRAKVVAIVGHEPHLGALVTWLISGVTTSHIELDKGGACLIEIDGKPRGGCATLLWSLPSAVLSKLGAG